MFCGNIFNATLRAKNVYSEPQQNLPNHPALGSQPLGAMIFISRAFWQEWQALYPADYVCDSGDKQN